MLEKCAKVIFFFAKQHKFFDTLYAEHPKISYIKFLALFLRDGDVMLSRGFDRPTPLESAPPVILILITSDPSLLHTPGLS